MKFNPAHRAVEYRWTGMISDRQARMGIRTINQIIRANQALHLVADLTRFTGASLRTATWVNEVWSEQLRAAGVQNVAVKMPQNALGAFTHTLAAGEKFTALLNVKG